LLQDLREKKPSGKKNETYDKKWQDLRSERGNRRAGVWPEKRAGGRGAVRSKKTLPPAHAGQPPLELSFRNRVVSRMTKNGAINLGTNERRDGRAADRAPRAARRAPLKFQNTS
jgi:hypothetical protein